MTKLGRISPETRSKLAFWFALAALILVSSLFYKDAYSFFKFPWVVDTWIYFLQLLVFVVSACIAYVTIASSRKTTIDKSTLDIILEDSKDTLLYDAKQSIFEFSHNPEDFYKRFKSVECQGERDDGQKYVRKQTLAELCTAENHTLDEAGLTIKKNLMHVLNRHEFYAIGINSGLMDERLFKRIHCSNIIKVWEVTAPAVFAFRAKRSKDTFFRDLELLALRWKAEPLKSEDIC